MSPRRALARPALALLIALALPLAAAGARAQGRDAGPAIPEPAGFVNDAAGVMDEVARARLEAFLDQLRRRTGVQFAVLTVRSTAPLSPSEYKVRVFERWGIGDRQRDDGLLMLVALEEREVRFETGYGLEGTLPDGFQSRVVREVIRDRFRAGDFAGGITQGVLALAARIGAEKGVALEWDGRELRYDRARGGRLPGLVVALLVFLVVVVIVTIVAAGGGDAWSMPRPGRRLHGGWGGGWGGGFGGGSSGGGSFGGGSFGGFGGGASGGGGGGGSW
jgi:uncharacterized protein